MKMSESSYVIIPDTARPTKTVLSFTEGPFAGVHFFIEKIRLEEDEKNDKCLLHFDYEVVSEHKHLEKDSKLQQQIGDLVVYLLGKSDRIIGSNDKNTSGLSNTRNQKPNTKRGILP
jgi:hypothetical protein